MLIYQKPSHIYKAKNPPSSGNDINATPFIGRQWFSLSAIVINTIFGAVIIRNRITEIILLRLNRNADWKIYLSFFAFS